MKMAESGIYSAVISLFAVFLLSGLASGLEIGEKCVTPDKAIGTCIKINDCPSFAEAIKVNPLPQATLDLLRKLQCGFQGSDPLSCCPSTTSTAVEEEVTEDVSNHPNIRLLKQEICGPFIDDKIIGGMRAKLSGLPWMVLIAYDVQSGNPFLCGGTIISDRYVLTAAHCVKFVPRNLKPISVRLGEHDILSDPDCEALYPDDPTSKVVCAPAPQDIPIEQVIAHEKYVGTLPLLNDVALIRLARPADFTPDSVRPICLPIGLPQQTLNLDGKKAVVSGWGVKDILTGQTSNVLLKVLLPVNSYATCSAAFKGTVAISSISQICTGDIKGGGDSCRGDSGGPLTSFASSSFRNVQYGIVSFGPKKCGSGVKPGVYTRVGHFMKWILDNMKD